jgi:hypothetical protein
MPAERLAVLPSAHLAQGFRFNTAWWTANKRSVVDAVTRWSIGG